MAFWDWKRSHQKQPSQYPHFLQKALLTSALKDYASEPRDRRELCEWAEKFLSKHGERWARLFKSNPRADAKWYNTQLRHVGAVVTRKGRRYSWNFDEVDRWSQCFRAKVLEQYENGRENEQWKLEVENLRTV